MKTTNILDANIYDDAVVYDNVALKNFAKYMVQKYKETIKL